MERVDQWDLADLWVLAGQWDLEGQWEVIWAWDQEVDRWVECGPAQWEARVDRWEVHHWVREELPAAVAAL